MPTQEELNAAQVELDIANDNYAKLAERYNRFQNVFKAYANATPEQQAKAQWVMQNALKAFDDLKLSMYAAEDRIQQAQNTVNNYNEIINNQPAQKTYQWVYTATPERQIITEVPAWELNNIVEEIPTQEVKELTVLPEWYTQEDINRYWIIWPQEVVAPSLDLTWKWTPTIGRQTSSTGRKINPVSNFTNTIKSIPNKVNWTVQMVQAAPGLLSNTNKTLGAYNQATTWNGVKWLKNNIQWGINLASSLPWTLKAANNFLWWYNTYRGGQI